MKSLQQAIREACQAAEINPQQVLRACVGAAGAGRSEIAATVRKIVAEIVSGEIEVVGDMEIALAAAFGAGPGVIVIAGTGSIVVWPRCARKNLLVPEVGASLFPTRDRLTGSAVAAVSAVLRAADQVGEERAEHDRSWPPRVFSAN